MTHPDSPWHERAACSNTDDPDFFPHHGERKLARERRERRVIQKWCAGCPVRVECLNDEVARLPVGTLSRTNIGVHGVRGGLTEDQQRERLLRRAVPAK